MVSKQNKTQNKTEESSFLIYIVQACEKKKLLEKLVHYNTTVARCSNYKVAGCVGKEAFRSGWSNPRQTVRTKTVLETNLHYGVWLFLLYWPLDINKNLTNKLSLQSTKESCPEKWNKSNKYTLSFFPNISIPQQKQLRNDKVLKFYIKINK